MVKIKENKLEKELFERVQSIDDLRDQKDLEDALLIVSGVDSKKKLHEYSTKLNQKYEQFMNHYENVSDNLLCGDSEKKAYLVHEFVGFGRVNRYRDESDASDFNSSGLKQILDRSEDFYFTEGLSDCKGGVQEEGIYNVRAGNSPKILKGDNHVLMTVPIEDGNVDIETTVPNGFGCEADRSDFQELDFRMILPIMIDSKANLAYYNGDLQESIKYDSKAIELFPNYHNAYTNRAITKLDVGARSNNKLYFKGALNDSNKAIEIMNEIKEKEGVTYSPSEAFNVRAIANHGLSNYKEAFSDYTKSISMGNTSAYLNRGMLNLKLNRPKKAINDFNSFLEIEKPEDSEKMNVLYYRGIAHLNNKDSKNAQKDFSSNFVDSKKKRFSHYYKARALLKDKDYKESLEEMSKYFTLRFAGMKRKMKKAKTEPVKIEVDDDDIYTEIQF